MHTKTVTIHRTVRVLSMSYAEIEKAVAYWLVNSEDFQLDNTELVIDFDQDIDTTEVIGAKVTLTVDHTKLPEVKP